MRNFLITVLIGIVTCFIAQTFIPLWWIFSPVTFIIALLHPYLSAGRRFFAGLLIVFITWMILYIFKDMANDSVMSDKIANLFSLKSNNWLFVVSSLIMGIIGGLTSLSAFFLRKK